MGLKLTLDKTKNRMFYTFEDAYWAITEPHYTSQLIDFSLKAYPNRESKLHDLHIQENPSLNYGSGSNSVDSELYQWHVIMDVREIFPDYIPVSKESQYTSIYNWIKEYTELPFTDVFEEEELTEQEGTTDE